MKTCSRRQLFKTTLIATALCSLPQPLLAASRRPLPIPPLLESRRGKPVILGFQTAQTKLIDDKVAEVWGINGNYLGPTVKVKQGDFVKLSYRNSLSQSVAINIQGLQVPSELMGGIGHSLKTEESWSPIVPITQSAGLCYYHSCSLANSAYQNYRGLVGMWIVEDDESRKASLPNKYGVNDIPLILQDHKINANGIQIFQQNEPHFYGERLLVNGQEAPYLNVSRGWIRLRLLNASLSRRYELAFDDEREMLLIAQDQGFLAESKPIKSLWLGAGERAEILVDLNEGGNVSLIVGKKRGIIDKAKLFFDSQNQLADNTVLELRPDGLGAVFNGKPIFRPAIPATLPTNISRERSFYLDTTNGMINQKRFDPRHIEVNVKSGTVERWIITASEPTTFRIQGARFVVESRQDNPTPENELVWKDTVWINGKTKILVQFNQLSSNQHPFIFGNADLMQADKGAIGLIVVQ